MAAWQYGTTGPCSNSAGPAVTFCPHQGISYVFLGDSQGTSNHEGFVRQRGIALGQTSSLAVSFFLAVETREPSTSAVDQLLIALRVDDPGNNDPLIAIPVMYSNLDKTSDWNVCSPYVQKSVSFQIPAQYRGATAVLDFEVDTSGNTCNESGHETIFRVDNVVVACVDCPTASGWGLGALSLLLVTAATVVLRRPTVGVFG